MENFFKYLFSSFHSLTIFPILLLRFQFAKTPKSIVVIYNLAVNKTNCLKWIEYVSLILLPLLPTIWVMYCISILHIMMIQSLACPSYCSFVNLLACPSDCLFVNSREMCFPHLRMITVVDHSKSPSLKTYKDMYFIL